MQTRVYFLLAALASSISSTTLQVDNVQRLWKMEGLLLNASLFGRQCFLLEWQNKPGFGHATVNVKNESLNECSSQYISTITSTADNIQSFIFRINKNMLIANCVSLELFELHSQSCRDLSISIFRFLLIFLEMFDKGSFVSLPGIQYIVYQF